MRKMIAPMIITLLVLAVLLFYVCALVVTSSQATGLFSNAFLLGTIVILIIIMITMVYVLVQRVKEIKEEDEDDLSKY